MPLWLVDLEVPNVFRSKSALFEHCRVVGVDLTELRFALVVVVVVAVVSVAVVVG
jgi:hypothetical protein